MGDLNITSDPPGGGRPSAMKDLPPPIVGAEVELGGASMVAQQGVY